MISQERSLDKKPPSLRPSIFFTLILALILVFGPMTFPISVSAQSSLPKGFVYVNTQIPDLILDLRYFGNNNFVGKKIDGYKANVCIIHGNAAKALAQVQAELKPFGLGLKIFDAYRPQSAVDHFVRWAKDISDTRMKTQFYPNVDKKDLFTKEYIASKSGHSRGSTVDLTIIDLSCDQDGKHPELDMGSGFDFFSPVSWPLSQVISPEQRANRMLLRTLMLKHGFKPYQQEWWHFTLKNEPFNNTYFNFPVE